MQQLSATGRSVVDDLSARYGFGPEAATALLGALASGGGSQAQFNHPDLGGMGQWSAGGMIMIGDMFNNGLKQRIDGFLSELAPALAAGGLFEPVAESGRRDGREGSGLFAPGGGGFGAAPWPDDLGRPSTSGAQNDLHYAYFPDSHRLAIRKGGHITLYDTADHAIGGVSQQQSGDQSLTFSSQYGTVRLADLKVISGGDPSDRAPLTRQPETTADAASARSSEPRPLARAWETAPPAIPTGEGDLIAMIERLATLRDRGILTEAEFAAKKAELLARL